MLLEKKGMAHRHVVKVARGKANTLTFVGRKPFSENSSESAFIHFVCWKKPI